jgi:hypothetical protein
MKGINMNDGYRLGDNEVDNVLRQTNQIRFEYFVKRVADWGEVWGLKGENGWVLSADDTGNQIAAFWPFKEYANLCSTGSWSQTEPTKIELSSFLDRWLPGLKQDGFFVSVFPNLAGQASVTDPLVLKEYLESEMEGLVDWSAHRLG